MYRTYEEKIELKQCPKCLSFEAEIVHGGLLHEYVRIQCPHCKKKTNKYYILSGSAAVELAADEWNNFERGIFVCQ